MKKVCFVLCVFLACCLEAVPFWDRANQIWNSFKLMLPKSVQNVLFAQLAEGESLFKRQNGMFYEKNSIYDQSVFTNLTENESQRENWYAVIPYIAEFWCTISNIGFFCVGWKHKSPELIFAGFASVFSHSISKQWLLYVDKFGVVLALSKFAREYKAIQKQPTLLLPLLGIGVLNTLDRYVARQRGETWSHILWHLGAAAIADYSLTRLKKQT